MRYAGSSLHFEALPGTSGIADEEEEETAGDPLAKH